MSGASKTDGIGAGAGAGKTDGDGTRASGPSASAAHPATSHEGQTRLVVTGAGIISALGPDVATTWKSLLAGVRGMRPITLFDASAYKSSLGAEVDGLRAVERDTWSRTAEMGLVAAREAYVEANLTDARARGLRVGLVVGSTTGGMFETETLLAVLANPVERETTKDDAWRKLLSNPISSTTEWIDTEIGPFARTRTLSSACSSGANAIIVAATWLLLDVVDIVIAGGADGLCRLTQAGFGALSACDPEPCKPFDVTRKGLNLGEGAGFLVLERDTTAASRGAKVRCELVGWAIGSEAHHITNPDASGRTPARLLTQALASAGLTASDLDYINAHGTATPLNDAMESAGLLAALGSEAARVPVSSSKAQLGHTLAAAGAIEAVITTLALRDGIVPATVGLTSPDPKCGVRHVTSVEKRPLRAAASTSFGFGGMDSVLVFAQPGYAGAKVVERHDVVVTGAAAVTPLGLATQAATHEVLDAPLPPDARVVVDSSLFDPTRVRRLDRLSRLGALVVERALGKLARHATEAPPYVDRVGILLGNAWGNLDASAAFMRRLEEKGPRLASPADFPNLVPSSPVGHISIYLGLSGPSFALVDFAASGEASFLQGFEMVASGEVRAVCVGGVEEKSDIVENVLSRVFDGRRNAPPQRAEGGAALTLTHLSLAEERGLPVLARVLSASAFRTAGGSPELASPGEDLGRALVVARDEATAARLLAGTPWATVAVRSGEISTGVHESAGAIFLAAAASLVASGRHARIAVVGETNGNGYAVVLG